MSLRIGTNVAALTAMRQFRQTQNQKTHALKSLASGKRIVNAGDDAAGFAISEQLRGQKLGLEQVRKNANNAISLVQVAEGGLNEQNNILIRLRELAIQSASDNVSDREREFLDKEFQQLTAEVDRISKSTNYSGKQLLTGTNEEFEFQVGTEAKEGNSIKFTLDADATASNLGVDSIGVSSKDDALDSLENIDDALFKMADMRSSYGAVQSRLNHAINAIDIQHENVSQAHSLVADADIAEETAKLAKANVMENIGTAVLAQSLRLPENASRLVEVL